MPASPSTIPYFRAALIAMLSARAPLRGVAIGDGPPSPDVLAGEEYIALLEAKGLQRIWAMNRASQPREERYTQTVEISVRGATRGDQVTLGSRAFALLAELELGVRADVKLSAYYTGGGALVSTIVGAEDYQTFADDSARESRITVGVNVHARL